MNTLNLSAISPIDGRYNKVTEDISKYFSEFALIRYRVYVEIEYFIALYEFKLPELKNIKKSKIKNLREIVSNFSINDAKRIKKIEEKINHDLKAVEYFIKEKFKKLGIDEYKEFVHYGLTSQDINNTAVPLMLKDCLKKVIIPSIKILLKSIKNKSSKFKNISMVSQDIILFDDTVRANIAYANMHASEEQINKACDFAAATEFIEKLPQKFETVILQ